MNNLNFYFYLSRKKKLGIEGIYLGQQNYKIFKFIYAVSIDGYCIADFLYLSFWQRDCIILYLRRYIPENQTECPYKKRLSHLHLNIFIEFVVHEIF